jgi:hypothetical protein
VTSRVIVPGKAFSTAASKLPPFRFLGPDPLRKSFILNGSLFVSFGINHVKEGGNGKAKQSFIGGG